MTGGVVVVLGPTGRNFAAGMSGGLAFVYDPDGTFRDRCNLEMVDLLPVEDYKDIGLLSNLINRHVLYTGSTVGDAIVNDFAAALPRFVKVFPTRLPPGAGAEQARAAAVGTGQWVSGEAVPPGCEAGSGEERPMESVERPQPAPGFGEEA